ncbi:hypothetical protein Hanom_Chr17g01551421 [Helianthus anomalus]
MLKYHISCFYHEDGRGHTPRTLDHPLTLNSMLGRWVWGSSPRAVLDQSPVAPPPCSVQTRCPGSSVQIPTVATSHSPTHTPLHTYILIYIKGFIPTP